MKAYSPMGKFRTVCCSLAALSLFVCLSASGFVLDNFSSKTGWVDTLNNGSATVAGGVFTIHTDNPNNSTTTSIKTSGATTPALNPPVFVFTNGGTLELRVDITNTLNASVDANALAILAWVKTGSSVLNADGNNYDLVVGANSFAIQKGSAVLYSTNGINLNATKFTLSLRITPSGSGVLLNARLYTQVTAGASGNYFTAIVEHTVTDGSAGLVSQNGNAALGVMNVANPNGSAISFANLQAFPIINSQLDPMSAAINDGFNPSSPWFPFSLASGGGPTIKNGDHVTVSGGKATFTANYVGSVGAGFAGIFYANKTFAVQDGARLEFTVDVVDDSTSAQAGRHSYAVLGFVPASGTASVINDIFRLIEYHVSEDSADTYNGKAYNGWWGHTTPAAPVPYPPNIYPNQNYRLTLTLTGEGSTCRLESRCEDLSLDINDPNRVFYQNVAIDTTAQDSFEAAFSTQPAIWFPYISPYVTAGTFAIDNFTDNSGVQAVTTFSNTVVNQTIPPVLPPILNNLAPNGGANFVATTTHITFDLSDAVNVVSNSIVVVLNGVTYTNGSPGMTVTPAAGTATSRHVDLNAGLAANNSYTGTVSAKGPTGLATTGSLFFDTFDANTVYVVESEEYNFTSAGGTGTPGQFFDPAPPSGTCPSGTPELLQEGSTDASCAYNGQVGSIGADSASSIDYWNHRGTGGTLQGYGLNHSFRYDDSQYTSRSPDPARAKYVNAGGANAGYYEEELGDIRDGDWLNYTHHYPSGVWNVYLRQSQNVSPLTLITLDQVTSDPTQPNQTTATLGSFIDSTPAGVGLFRNVPLTDGVGNPIPLRLDGSQKTFRISQRVTGERAGGILEQNYFVLVPTADPGTLRPIVSSTSPLAGQNVACDGQNDTASVAPSLTIANRDTTVNVGSVVLTLNGVTPPSATVSAITGGATVSWSAADMPAAPVITNNVAFTDSDSVPTNYTWTYSYPYLQPSNSFPSGTFFLPGWSVRMVYTNTGDPNGPTLGNSLARAEQQLAIPPQIAYNETTQVVMQAMNWADEGDGTTAQNFGINFGTPTGVPGLAPDGSHNNMATESLGYLYLTAGLHRFGVFSDDGWSIKSGSGLRDPNATIVGFRDGGTYDGGTFDFIAGATGMYPFRVAWYENGGSAHFQLYSQDPNNANTRALVGDTGNGGIAVYQPIGVLAATNARGPYGAAVGASIDTVAQTVTVPMSGSAQFFRMVTVNPVRLSNIHRDQSGNIIFHYQ